MNERTAAIERGDLELTQTLNARINACKEKLSMNRDRDTERHKQKLITMGKRRAT